MESERAGNDALEFIVELLQKKNKKNIVEREKGVGLSMQLIWVLMRRTWFISSDD